MSISDRVATLVEEELQSIIGKRFRTVFMSRSVLFEEDAPLLIEKASFYWCTTGGDYEENPGYNVYLQGRNTETQQVFLITVDIRDLP